MKSVLHRDRVKARIVRYDKKGRPEGRVLEILERKKAPIIGRLLHESGIWLLAPEDKRYGQDIIVPKNGIADAKAGQVVAIELMEPPSMHSQPVGRVTEVLGEIDDPGMEIEIAVRKYEVPHIFSDAALAQAAALPDEVGNADRKGRVDLTDVALVTIDGEDARDFDDAVYCEPARLGKSKVDNGWRLVVAIADVSHYVRPGEPIDLDAYERATSVYFPRRVIPMLPEKLSNGLCSLNPEVERLAMVCDMLVDEGGEVEAYQFFPAVIRSAARFTYTEVAAILANTRGPEAARRTALVPHLLDLHDVYRALLKARVKRGAVDFETTETQIVCDENGRIEKIVPRTRNEAHRLIEESMLAANVCSADFIARAKHPALYRVHEGPTPEKKTLLQNYLKALGLGLSISDDPSPAEYQAIAAATKERPDAQQIHQMLLRSMQQAIYTSKNIGHFGLAYEAYTHFTSPIRRYPDLLVHRVIKALLESRRYAIGARSEGEPAKKARLAKAVKSAKAREGRHGAGAARSGRRARGVGNRRRALQRERAPCRRGLARRRGVAQVPLHARAPRRGIRRRRQRGDELRPVRHARRPVRRRAGPRHRAGRRVLPLRRGAPGAARRAFGHALRGRNAGAGAGEPGRPRRPQDRFPPGARQRGSRRRAADAARQGRGAQRIGDERDRRPEGGRSRGEGRRQGEGARAFRRDVAAGARRQGRRSQDDGRRPRRRARHAAPLIDTVHPRPLTETNP